MTDLTNTRKITFGPIVGAVAIFVILAFTAVATWYMTKENIKGDIAKSEVEIRKTDNFVQKKLDEEFSVKEKQIEDYYKDRDLPGDWADRTVYELRTGLQPEQIDQ